MAGTPSRAAARTICAIWSRLSATRTSPAGPPNRNVVKSANARGSSGPAAVGGSALTSGTLFTLG
jgi:hypothetical protein